MSRTPPAPASLSPPARTFPDYGAPYFQHLLADVENLREELADPKNEATAALIHDLVARQKLTWGDLYAMEKAVLQITPELQLRRKAWDLRDKYRVVFGNDVYDVYLKSNPPDAATADLELLRADLSQLLDDLHWKYAMTPVREKVRNDIIVWISRFMGLFFVMLLIAMVFFFAFPKSGFARFDGVMLWVAVLWMGATGASVSLQQRIQGMPASGDAMVNVLALHSGGWSVYTAPITGALFATLLGLLMLGGLLQGDMFPEFGKGEWGLRQLLTGHAKDLAKLLVWSFIAGFAERFVPDTLTRMIIRPPTPTSDTPPKNS